MTAKGTTTRVTDSAKVDRAWATIDDTTKKLKAEQKVMDDLYQRRADAYRVLVANGISVAAIARHLGANPRGVKIAMENRPAK